MNANIREKVIYGEDVEIVKREDDCNVYRISNDSGAVVMTSYVVFPGIELIYNDVHIQTCDVDRGEIGNVLEINHCREGRIECGYCNEYVYLTPGDLTIARKKDAAHSSYFPLSHYHGITISIDLDHLQKNFGNIFDYTNMNPVLIAEKFCSDKQCFITRSNSSVEHIFSELYNVPEKIRKDYFKIKVLELLLFLNGMEKSEKDVSASIYSQSQVKLAKSVCEHLTKHMDDRVTLDQLSQIFHVSGTRIKTSFKGVYGVSMYAYIRTQKMQEAAHMLLHTNYTVLNIAGHFGYDNASKFAAAFRTVMGMTPAEYRANNVE